MLIPYKYNKMAAGTVVSQVRPIAGERGVFTYLGNGCCNRCAMTVENVFMTYSKTRSMDVFSSGIALKTTAGYYAGINVYSGGAVSATVVNSYASLVVMDGGTAYDTELNQHGHLDVGGTAIGGEVHYYASCIVRDNACLSNFDFTSGCYVYGSGSNVNYCSITISQGANFYAGSSGCSIRHLSITSNASFACGTGMDVRHVTVMDGGCLNVDSGAQCHDVLLGAGARMSQGVWGHDEDTLVTGSNEYGSFWLSNGTACNYVLSSGFSQSLYYYGSASHTIISSYGQQNVSFGCVAQDTVISSGGSQNIDSQGHAEDTVVSGRGCQRVEPFGTAIRTTVKSGGSFCVSSYGRVYDAVVESGGSCNIDNGSANNLKVCGSVYLADGVRGNSIAIVSSGSMYAYQACSCADLSISDGGSASLTGNCEISGCHIGSGGCLNAGNMCVFNNLTVENGTAGISGYCVASHISVHTTGRLYGSQQCNVDDLHIGFRGSGSFCSGCDVQNVTGSSRSFFVLQEDCRGENILLEPGGYAVFTDSCNVSNVSIASKAIVSMDKWTILRDVKVNGTLTLKSSACVVSNASVFPQGSVVMGSRTYATSVTVESGGSLYVSNRASAFAVSSAAGAVIVVESGGYIEYTN